MAQHFYARIPPKNAGFQYIPMTASHTRYTNHMAMVCTVYSTSGQRYVYITYFVILTTTQQHRDPVVVSNGSNIIVILVITHYITHSNLHKTHLLHCCIIKSHKYYTHPPNESAALLRGKEFLQKIKYSNSTSTIPRISTVNTHSTVYIAPNRL